MPLGPLWHRPDGSWRYPFTVPAVVSELRVALEEQVYRRLTVLHPAPRGVDEPPDPVRFARGEHRSVEIGRHVVGQSQKVDSKPRWLLSTISTL